MTLYCGIDMGRRKSFFCMMNEERKILAEKSLENNDKDIEAFLTPFGPDLACVFESSSCWYWLSDFLKERGYRVLMAHTLKLAMITNAKVKTDRKDARRLAEHLANNYIPEGYIYPKEKRSLRDLVRYRFDLVAKRTALYTNTHLILNREGFFNHNRNSIKDISKEDVEKLFAPQPLLVVRAHQMLDSIDLLDKQISELEKRMRVEMKNEKLFEVLKAIPGVGDILGMSIWVEVGEIERFKTSSNFCSYCRVAPGIAQSGKIVGRSRGAKQGNSYLKGALMQAAIVAVRSNSRIKKFYEDRLERHQGSGGKMVCYNAVAHKLGHAVFHILRGTSMDLKKLFPTREESQIPNPV